MSLNILKQRLQSALNESTESEDFINALEDGLYSCQFDTVTALTSWFMAWLTNEPCVSSADIEYKEGVQFVADTWDKIKGEG